MTSKEKNTWVYAALAVVIPAIYALAVFGLGVDYATALPIAIVAAIVLAVIVSIVIAVVSRDRGITDERDALITRRGELVGYYVLSAGVIGVLVLVLTEQSYFWLAHSIYAAFFVSAIASSAVKLVAYRRGF